MPFIPFDVSAASGQLVGTYQYKINETTGGLELWKGQEKIAEQNADGSWFKTAVSTGVGSLHLGGGDSSDPAHSVSSAGQNVVFKNEAFNATTGEAVVWFPAGWQALRQDLGGTPYTPTFLQFGDIMSAYEPNGQAHPSNIVNYDFVTTIPTSVVASRLQVVAGETYSGKVTNIIMSNPKGVELHSTSATINVTAGQLFWLEYPSLYFARSGDNLRLIIRKADGSPLKVRGGLINTSLPYRRLVARTFSDINVGNVHIGDIKEFYGTSDHNGWVLMDGRNVSALTATQRSAAATIGLTSTLPDARNRVGIGAGNLYGRGSTGGDVKIAKAMLPNITITGRTDSGDAHRHGPGSLATGPESGHTHPANQQYSYNYSRLDGGDDSTGTWAFATFSTQQTGLSTGHTHTTMTGDTANESTHKHYFTSDSINGNVTQTDHLPPYIAFGKFIYLGL